MSTPDALDQWVDRFMSGDLHDDPAPVRERGGLSARDLEEVWSEFVSEHPDAVALSDRMGVVLQSLDFGPATSRADARRQLGQAFATSSALRSVAEKRQDAGLERAFLLLHDEDDVESALDALLEAGVTPGDPRFEEFTSDLHDTDVWRAEAWLSERAAEAKAQEESEIQARADAEYAAAVEEARALGRESAKVLAAFEKEHPGVFARIDEATGLASELVGLAASPDALNAALEQGARFLEEQDRVSPFELAVDKMLNDSEIAPGDHAVRSGYAAPRGHKPGISVDEQYVETGRRSNEPDPLAGMSAADVDEFVSGIMSGSGLGPQSTEIQSAAMRAEEFERQSRLHEIEHGYPLTGWRDPADKVAEGPPSD